VTNPRDLMACANSQCLQCAGSGVRLAGRSTSTFGESSDKTEAVCPCCYRQIARIVLARVRIYAESGHTIRTNMMQFANGSNRIGRRATGRKAEELCADAFLIAKRTLTACEFDIYKRHFLLGKPWTEFSYMVRGQFFHSCYRIEEKLGERYVNLKPYPLFALDAYLSTDHALNRQADVRPFYPKQPRVGGIPLVPPMQPRPVVVEVARPVPPPKLKVLVMLAPTVPEQPSTEQQIRRWLKDGLSLDSIRNRLTNAGVPTPSGAEKWADSHIKKILMAKRAA
jgi:Recombinase